LFEVRKTANPERRFLVQLVQHACAQSACKRSRAGGAGIAVTASIGIAEWRPDGPIDVRALLGHADHAVHEAKGRGRDTIVRHEEIANSPAAGPAAVSSGR